MLYVALGRNVGDVPMSDDEWEKFRIAVCNVIFDLETHTDPDTVAFGKSRYGAMEEETCVLVWFDRGQALRKETLLALNPVAIRYGQECIAYSVSDTQYVEGIG
ncbi:MAG: hypothetical protein EBU08_18195 [Micrococcales bacterium]|nr:hypothetical protein [Micrococcales bacterium]